MTQTTRDWSAYPKPDDIFPRNLDAAVDRILDLLDASSVNDPKLAQKVHAGIDLFPRRAELARCLDWVRRHYLETVYPEWLARETEQGSPWRPTKRMPRPANDIYRRWRPTRRDEDRQWNDLWGKPDSLTGARRRKPSDFERISNPGAPVGREPLVWIYHIIKEWWWRNVGRAFRPKFNRDENLPEFAQIAMMNPAARFFLLFAQEVDHHYTSRHCASVAREEGRYQRSGTKVAAMIKKAAKAKERYEQKKSR